MILVPKGNIPNARELRGYILDVMGRFPILHLMSLDNAVDQREHPYIITRLVSERYTIKPNITQQGFLFYGMPLPNINGGIEQYAKQRILFSKLAFEQVKMNLKARLYYNVLREDFSLMLRSYPLYALLQDGISFGSGRIFRIENPYGIADLYDSPTSLIRMTSDIDIALLQAVTDYNTETKTFNATNSQYGALFVFELRQPFGYTPGLSNLGQLPLGRALDSKHFLYDLPDNMSFSELPNVKAFVFRQDSNVSQSILAESENGNRLYPSVDADPFMRKVMSQDNHRVSRVAFESNLRSNPRDDRNTNIQILQSLGCAIDDNYHYGFTRAELIEMQPVMMDWWNRFTSQLYSPYKRENELVELLKDLPSNPIYCRYFDINQFADHEGIE